VEEMNRCMQGKNRNAHGVFCGKPRRRETIRKTQTQVGQNIRMDLGKQDREVWAGLIWLRIGTISCSCDHGKENLRVPYNVGKFLNI
jgi:hypothetical protein